MRFGTSVLLLALAVPFHAWSVDKGEITFHKHVEPILQRHCQGCHRPGEAAPFSLLSYKDTRPWAKSIRAAVLQRKMPPWFANAAHGKFANDRRLSASEIETIQAWVDQGASQGKLGDAPPPLVFSSGWKIGEPDLVVELPVEFPVPAGGTIDYTWFAADMGLTEDRWIERVEVRPGDRKVVHHALVFARAPGNPYRSDLQPGSVKSRPEAPRNNPPKESDAGAFAVGNNFPSGVEMIGDYVVNGDPFVAAPGHARLVRAGSHMLFQMHYTSSGTATKDRTKVGIVFAKKPPKFRIVNDAVLNATLRIPPGAPNHQVTAVATFQHDTALGGFGPHMHVRGKAMRYELLQAGTSEGTILLDVPSYDFNWQLKYEPKSLVPVKKGDRIRITAWYDNSSNNRYNPDPSVEVRWGDQSWAEMLFAFFDYVIPADVDPAAVTGGVRTAAKPPTAN
jgi:hypothetical protein